MLAFNTAFFHSFLFLNGIKAVCTNLYFEYKEKKEDLPLHHVRLFNF